MNPPKPSTVHILLVDDERLSRVVVANLLRKCSYKVTVAEGGSEALQLLQDKPPGTFHLVLTDVMMPQVGGLDLLRYVRSHKHLSDLPVVMMSASEQAEMMYTCIRGGAEEYLIKPVTQKEVQNIWTHVIKRLSLAMDAATQRALEEAASCEEQVSPASGAPSRGPLPVLPALACPSHTTPHFVLHPPHTTAAGVTVPGSHFPGASQLQAAVGHSHTAQWQWPVHSTGHPGSFQAASRAAHHPSSLLLTHPSQTQAQAGQAQPLDHSLLPMTSQAELLQGSGVQVAVALRLERQRPRGPAGLQQPLPATAQLPANLLNHHPWTQQVAEERGGGGESQAGEEEVGGCWEGGGGEEGGGGTGRQGRAREAAGEGAAPASKRMRQVALERLPLAPALLQPSHRQGHTPAGAGEHAGSTPALSSAKHWPSISQGPGRAAGAGGAALGTEAVPLCGVSAPVNLLAWLRGQERRSTPLVTKLRILAQVLLLSSPSKAGTDPLPPLPRVRPSSFTLHPNGNVTLKPPQLKCDHAWKPMRTTSPGLPAPSPALPSPPLTLAHPGAGHSQRRSAPGLPASLRMNGPDLISHGAHLSGSLKHDVMTLRRQHTQVQQDAQALLFEFMRGRHTLAPAAAVAPAPGAAAAPDPLAPGVGDLVGQRVDAAGEVAGRGNLGGAGAAAAAGQQAGPRGKVLAEAAIATDESVGKAATAAVAASGAVVSSPGAGTAIGRAGLPCWQQGLQGQGVGGSVSGAAAGWVGGGVSGEDEACYTSPEELAGAVPSTASTMYSLGVLMFDLLYQAPGNTAQEQAAGRCQALRQLHQRCLPAPFLLQFSQAAVIILTLLHPSPSERPSEADLLQSSMLRQVVTALAAAPLPPHPHHHEGVQGGMEGHSCEAELQAEGEEQMAKLQAAAAEQAAAAAASRTRLNAVMVADFLEVARQRKAQQVARAQEQLVSLDADIVQLRRCLAAVAPPPAPEPPPSSARPPLRQSSCTLLSPRASHPPHPQHLPHSPRAPPLSPPSARPGGTAPGKQGLAPVATAPDCSAAQGLGCSRAAAAAAVAGGSDAVGPVASEGCLVQSPSRDPGGSGACDPDATQDAAYAAAALSWEKVKPHFDDLLMVFTERRTATTTPTSDHAQQDAAAQRSAGQASASPPDLPAYIASFSHDVAHFVRHTRFELRASLRYGEVPSPGNMVCSAAFDRDDEFFAAAGVSKRIRIYEQAAVVASAPVGVAYPVLEIRSRSRLSSVCWSSYIQGHLASSDYEGVVSLWDVNTSTELQQYEEHAKRVWSVDFSRVDPTRLASCSDDGTVRVWGITQEQSMFTIDCKVNACSVQWSPTSCHQLAVGASNCQAYLYDLRRHTLPLLTITGHTCPVSYVRHVSATQLLTSSTDNTIRLWDIQSGAEALVSPGLAQPESTSPDQAGAGGRHDNALDHGLPAGQLAAPRQVQRYSGHLNERNFVGLSVSADGTHFACGSENNHVFCYYKGLPLPCIAHSFTAPPDPPGALACGLDGATSQETCGAASHHGFVSSVCWSHRGATLLAANSMGNIQLLAMV